jgi:hypothetical protein
VLRAMSPVLGEVIATLHLVYFSCCFLDWLSSGLQSHRRVSAWQTRSLNRRHKPASGTERLSANWCCTWRANIPGTKG